MNLNKLKILVVDNGIDSPEQYKDLIPDANIYIESDPEKWEENSESFDLIILSDGSKVNVVDNKKGVELVLSTNRPIIGICYGFQLLCYAYGSILGQLPEKREGLIDIETTDSQLFEDGKLFQVIEKHRYAVKRPSEDLECLARSVDGCEIVKVKNKPQFALQFHPEMTEPENDGMRLFNQILNLTLSS